MNHYSGNETVNAGTGKELTIRELTELVAKVTGYNGEIRWDTTKPNGTPRKLLDVSKSAALAGPTRQNWGMASVLPMRISSIILCVQKDKGRVWHEYSFIIRWFREKIVAPFQ